MDRKGKPETMRRPTAALGSALFFLLAPGVVVGLLPWLLTDGWQAREPVPYWAPMRMLGGINDAAVCEKTYIGEECIHIMHRSRTSKGR